MSDEIYEQLLLEAAQEGDIDSYEELQLLLEPDIRRFVQGKIYDSFTVDDVIQEVFLSFYQNMHRIDPVENLRPYIFRIARNKCYDDLRKFQRNENISLDDEPVRARVSFTESGNQLKPDDVTHWMLLHIEVQEAIAQLPETQRETLVLYSEEQMTYAEIADIMDCSIGTVKSRLYYAKKNLRGLMNPETLSVIDDEFDDTPKTPKKNKNDEIVSKREQIKAPEIIEEKNEVIYEPVP